MTNTVDYAVYVIDLTDAMLNHRKGLNAQQIDHLGTINRRAVDFVTSFLQHENADLDTLFSYLSHDAMAPIALIIGYSEFMLMGGAGGMLPAYRDAMQEIRDCGYALQEDMQNMMEELQEFMESIGYERQTKTGQAAKVQESKPIQAIVAKEEETQPPSPKRIQPLAPKVSESQVVTAQNSPKPIQKIQSLPR
jgi:hypothetical protein